MQRDTGGQAVGETGLAQTGAPGHGLPGAQEAPGHAEMSEVMADFRAGTVSAISTGWLGKRVVR